MCKERREEVESDASTHYVVDVWSCSWGEQYTLKQSFSSRTTQSFICRRVIKDNASQGCAGRSLIGINLDGIMLGEFCFRSLRLRNEMNQRERERKKKTSKERPSVWIVGDRTRRWAGELRGTLMGLKAITECAGRHHATHLERENQRERERELSTCFYYAQISQFRPVCRDGYRDASTLPHVTPNLCSNCELHSRT